MAKRTVSLLLVLVLFLPGCAHQRPADGYDDESALLAAHERVLEAHRRGDVEMLLGDAREGFVVANRGAITYPTIEEQRRRLGGYLGRTRFSVYRDQVPPVVKVSADGTLGWVIAQVEAKGEQTADDGTTVPLEFVSAWIELYEKRDGTWVSIGNLSNFKP
ncbi:MAG: hypothetical protein ACSLFQ_17060 [Thermoanaerobaculia bacterium]